MSELAAGTLEGLLSNVEALPDRIKSFDLFVPQDLIWMGHPVAPDVAMTVLVDKLLGKGLFPDGFDQRAVGRRYKAIDDRKAHWLDVAAIEHYLRRVDRHQQLLDLIRQRVDLLMAEAQGIERHIIHQFLEGAEQLRTVSLRLLGEPVVGDRVAEGV